MPNDQELQQAYSRILAGHGPVSRDGCVTPEAILALAEGSEDEGVRLQALDHVMACPPCREDFELLRGLARTRQQTVTSKRHSSFFSPKRLAWAASLVLTLGAGSIWWSSQGAGPAGVMRGDGTGFELISPADGGLIADGMTFTWHAVPGAFAYDLEILDRDGEVVFQASTPDTTLALEALPSMEGVPGSTWWVTARTGGGSRISSPLRPLGSGPR